MKQTTGLVIVLITAGLVTSIGCGKKSKATTSAPESATSSTVTPTPVSTSVKPSGPEGAGEANTTAKLAGAEWAMKQDQIKNDSNGQWAVAATASSTYEDAKESERWAANQVTGTPNVEKYGDDGNAWASKTEDSGTEWLDVTFAKPVYATEVRIRESCGSGTIIRIDLFDEQGASHTVWSGADPTTELNYLMITFPKTAYKTNRIKITLATNVVQGWNEIDAIQLVGR